MQKLTAWQSDLLETGRHHFTADASTLGFPAGWVPGRLATDIGNGLDLLLSKHDANCFTYIQELGCAILVVFNT